MAALTTRQRDILRILLDANRPVTTAELAEQMHLTPRQVNYGLKGLKQWLAAEEMTLAVTPGVGVALPYTGRESDKLLRNICDPQKLQLILTPEQRQQLLALLLIDSDEPFILHQLEQWLAVSRTTILADLNALEPWLETHGLQMERRPNYGIEIQGDEPGRRQALGAWAWGDTPFGPGLAPVTHNSGITFELAEDRALLPIVERAAGIINGWRIPRLFGQVAYVEAQLGGRFSDDAVLFLALIFAIQAARIEAGHMIITHHPEMDWLQTHPVWHTAEELASRLHWGVGKKWPATEVAFVTRYLLAAPRNERWPGDLDVDSSFATLVDQMMGHISACYEIPALEQDKMLRDGIVVHAIPAYLRRRFNLWLPSPLPASVLSEEYAFEHEVTAELAEMFAHQFDAELPQSDIDNIALLLRAAYIRERPYRLREVIVICPSGMASAQLLMARLRARFPLLGNPVSLSIRELTERHVERADLVLTTIPLRPELDKYENVLHVHQLLFPEDVEAITAWLSSR